MKIIKWILCLLLFLTFFLYLGEAYQNHLYNFEEGIDHITDAVKPTETTVANFCELLGEISSENNVHVFTIDRDISEVGKIRCHIFADAESAEVIKNKYGILEGTFNSVFSGVTEVSVHDISEWPAYSAGNDRLLDYYLIGSSSDIGLLEDEIIRQYGEVSNVWEGKTIITNFIIIGIWGVILAFILLLTWFEIQFELKKEFIKISLGMSKGRVISRRIISDSFVIIALFAVSHFLTNIFIYADYQIKHMTVMFAVFVLCNALINFVITRYSYKKIIYGANINPKLLINCFTLKAFATIIVICSISINLSYIINNEGWIRLEKVIEGYDGYVFLDMEFEVGDYEYVDPQKQQDTIEKVSRDEGLIDKGMLATDVYPYAWEPQVQEQILLYNKKGIPWITSEKIIKQVNDGEYDFYFFINEDSASNLPEDTLFNIVHRYYGLEKGDYTYSAELYKGGIKSFYVAPESEYGFDGAENPLIIICAIDDQELFEKGVKDFLIVDKEAFFLTDEDLSEMEQRYGLLKLSGTSLIDLYTHNFRIINRIILLNSILSSIMLVLELLLIAVIIKLEYMVNSQILSIKKILGHKIFRKNGATLLLNVAILTGATGINILITTMFDGFKWFHPVICGIAMFAVETIIMILNINRYEKTNTIKILKGGCL